MSQEYCYFCPSDFEYKAPNEPSSNQSGPISVQEIPESSAMSETQSFASEIQGIYPNDTSFTFKTPQNYQNLMNGDQN